MWFNDFLFQSDRNEFAQLPSSGLKAAVPNRAFFVELFPYLIPSYLFIQDFKKNLAVPVIYTNYWVHLNKKSNEGTEKTLLLEGLNFAKNNILEY